MIGIICCPGAIAAAAKAYPQKHQQQQKTNTMNRLKQLVASLVAILTEALHTPRDNAEKLAELQKKYDDAQAKISDLEGKLAADEEALKQEAVDEAALAETLQDALTAAAAARPPTDEQKVIAATGLESGNNNNENPE